MKQRTWSKFTVSKAELARLIGRDIGCIDRWTQFGGLPRKENRRYHLKTALRWIERHYKHSLTIHFSLNGLTQQQLAELLSVSRQAIHNWDRSGLPRNDDGSYDLHLVLRWLLNTKNVKPVESSVK